MELYLIRHGETEWSRARRHTGRTDLPLSPAGEAEARALGQHLRGLEVDRVLSSPLTRATTTAALAGFGERVELTDALLEVDYGDYEGLTTTEIRASRPGWDLFRDGCPGGETPEQMAKRVDALIEELRELGGNTLLFGHGHCFRSVTARFLDLPIRYATNLRLDAGTISIVTDGRDGPALVLWNRRVQPRAVVVADIAASIARTVP